MKTSQRILVSLAALSAVLCVQAQITVSPLTTFGGGDGWLAPGEGGYAYLGTGNSERGFAYNPVSGNLLLVSRANPTTTNGLNIRVLNALTGADLSPYGTGGLNVGSGIVSGGTFGINTVRVAGDGAIYVGNLASPVNPGAFKVYRWANESSIPTVAFSSTAITTGRMGDTFDVIGSGASTLLVAGESNSGGSGARNGYAVLATADGVSYTGTLVAFPVSPNPGFTSAGDFRLGVTFTDSSHVIGAQAGPAGPPASTQPRYTSFSGTSGSLLGTPVLSGSNFQTIMDYAEIGGLRFLATQSYGDSAVRIWDVGDLSSPVLAASGNNTSGTLTSNGNGSGQMAWGDITDNGNGTWSAKLWTMSSNQGIQAFTVLVPEPGTAGLAVVGGLLLAAWTARRRRS